MEWKTEQTTKKPSRMTSEDKKHDEASMPLSGHLRELRKRLVIVAIVLFAFVLISLRFAPQIVTVLTDMGSGYGYQFVYLAPQELLLVYLNIALICGCVLTLPVFVYHAYGFCSPGLEKKEQTFAKLALVGGTGCFLLGVAFARYVSLPFMLSFLIQFTSQVDVSASISIDQYVSFLLTVFIIFGCVFELPVVTVLLTALGIIKADWLAKGRKVMIVVIFFIAAVITPPDIVSQIMVALPIVLLYQISILLSRLVEKRKKQDEA